MKPGVMTTEFWMTLLKLVISTGLSLLVLFGKLNQDQANNLSASLLAAIVAVVGMLTNAHAVVGYVKHRTALKLASLEK